MAIGGAQEAVLDGFTMDGDDRLPKELALSGALVLHPWQQRHAVLPSKSSQHALKNPPVWRSPTRLWSRGRNLGSLPGPRSEVGRSKNY